MSKKKLTYRYSKSLNYPANYYGWGSDFANAFKKEFANSREAFAKTFTGANVGKTLANNIGGIGQAIGTTISGDFNTGTGNAISSIGGTIGNIIPGPIGGIVSGVTGVVGGLVNRMFGSTLNNENIARIEGNNRAISNVLVDNSDYDSILNQWGTQDFGSVFTQSDVGKDGWFSNKAKNKYKQLLKEQGIARNRALMAYADAIDSADTQSDLNLLAQSFANGGPLQAYGTDWDNGVTIIGNGDTHENNIYDGVQIGVDPEGIPNLVEEGEVIFNDYVFSNRLTVPKAVRKKYKLRGNKDITFANAAKQMQKESEERPNDPISKRGLEDSMMRLMANQEEIREQRGVSNNNRFDEGGWTEYLRYAPVAGSIIGLGQNLLSKPDYSNATTIENVAKDMGNYTPVGFDAVSNYLSYNPFDTNFYINKLNAQSGATRRAIMNTSSPSRNAALLAADYNAQGKLGDLARQAEEYNLAQRQQVENFNRATNMANAEMGLKAAMANQDAELKAKNAKLSGIAQAMAMREAIDARRSESMSANMTNLFESLGNIGIDEANRGDVRWLIKSGAIDMSIADIASRFGNSFAREIGKSKGMPSEELDGILNSKSNRGRLGKKRGGFTY